jgi:hypothetical protein
MAAKAGHVDLSKYPTNSKQKRLDTWKQNACQRCGKKVSRAKQVALVHDGRDKDGAWLNMSTEKATEDNHYCESCAKARMAALSPRTPGNGRKRSGSGSAKAAKSSKNGKTASRPAPKKRQVRSQSGSAKSGSGSAKQTEKAPV